MARSDTDHPLHTYAKQASNIARILDNAGIPNVLFGWLALGLTGADIEPELPAAQIDFIINDRHLSSATNALTGALAGLTLCTNRACPDLVNSDRNLLKTNLTVVAAAHFHFHLHPRSPPASPPPTISLHLHSRTLHFLSPASRLTLHPPPTNEYKPTFTTTGTNNADPCGLAAAASSSPIPGPDLCHGLYPMKLLTPRALAETVLFLLCRDDQEVPFLTRPWEAMLRAMLRPEGLRSERKDLIERDIRAEFLDAWVRVDGRGMGEGITRYVTEMEDWGGVRALRELLAGEGWFS